MLQNYIVALENEIKQTLNQYQILVKRLDAYLIEGLKKRGIHGVYIKTGEEDPEEKPEEETQPEEQKPEEETQPDEQKPDEEKKAEEQDPEDHTGGDSCL